MRTFRTLFYLIFAASLLFSTSCKTEAPIDPPRAIFEFEIASDNSGTVSFENFSVGADTYLWDFGDGAGTSTEENPTYTYKNSGKYTVKLTVTNEGGENATTLEVPVATNIVDGGDMANETKWMFRNVWADNIVNHAFLNDAFVWDNSDSAAYSQAYLWQEVQIEAGKEYKFSATIKSAGTQDIWFELYLGNSDPASDDDYKSNGLRLYVSSFDSPDSGCANDAFDGDFVSVAQGCTPDPSEMKILPPAGTFTLSQDELTANGTVYLVFKAGTWDSQENFKDGITLDDISIVEVL